MVYFINLCIQNSIKGGKLITTLDELIEFDRRVSAIPGMKRLLVRPGSITKVPSVAYLRWGIDQLMLRQDLAERSEFFYLKDIKDAERNPELESFARNGEYKQLEESMARRMAITAAEMARSVCASREGTIRICELPANNALVSTGIIGQLQEEWSPTGPLSRSEFHLVDYSYVKLIRSEQRMDFRNVNFRTERSTDMLFLEGLSQGPRMDIIIMLNHLHTKSFPDIFAKAYEALAENGVLIIGDWHSALWNHPLNAYKLLERIGAEQATLKAFSELFGPILMDPGPLPKMEPEEWQALEDHFTYWQDTAGLMSRSTDGAKPRRLHFLEAHDTSSERRKKLEAAGFTLDMDRIRAAFPGARLVDFPQRIKNKSDFAVVMVALKRGKSGG